MPSLDYAGLSPGERARVESVLASEPCLARELGAIAGALSPEARDRFWIAFATECERQERPAAAVLAALERAALRVDR